MTGAPAPSALKFPMAIDPRWRLVLRLWGVKPGRAYVRLNGDALEARFGWWLARTITDNVASWTLTGPYRWITAIGLRSSPPFRHFAFDTNTRAGVDLRFRRPVRFGRVFRAAVLTVTVADTDALAAALRQRGIPGEDRRRR